MSRLAKLIADGNIQAEELVEAPELIQRARLVKEGLEACHKTILFPLKVDKVKCYSYTDSAGEREAWGICMRDGMFICFSNWGGDHEIGRCNLNDFSDVFMSFENENFEFDLRRFLKEQIDAAQ